VLFNFHRNENVCEYGYNDDGVGDDSTRNGVAQLATPAFNF